MLKRFDFFSRALVERDGIALDYHRNMNPHHAGHEALARVDDFTCCAAGAGWVVFGDKRGGLTIMGARSLRPRRHVVVTQEAVAQVQVIGETLLVVTATSLVIVLRLNSSRMASDEPPITVNTLETARNALKRRESAQVKPNCALLHKDFANLAIGYPDGYVLLLQSRDFRDSNARELSPAWLTSNQSGGCTGLGFSPDAQHIWVAYEKRVSVFSMENKFESRLDKDEEDQGCKLGCASVGPDEKFFVVGRRDRLAFYTTEMAGSCYSILGERQRLTKCKEYIVSLSSGDTWKGFGNVAVVDKRKKDDDSTRLPSGIAQRCTLQIIDLQHKYVAHEFNLDQETCAFIAADEETSSIFVLTKSDKQQRLWRLQEKDIDVRLDYLQKRNLFSTAALLARSYGRDPGFIAEIYRKYGDHLYEKGNYDDAVTQYVHTIGKVPPSDIICRFLDAPRVKNLTTYLEALHSDDDSLTASGHGGRKEIFVPGGSSGPNQLKREPALNGQVNAVPSKEHTSLLFTCYAKLKEDDKINNLLFNKNAQIHVGAALAVLKDTGRLEPALKFAKEKGEDIWYVQTLLELADQTNPHNALLALEFIKEGNKVNLLQKFTVNMLSLVPRETLACVKSWISRKILRVEDIMDKFADYPEALEELCHNSIIAIDDRDEKSIPSTLVWNICLELSLAHQHLDVAWELLTHPRCNVDLNFALAAVRMNKFRRGELFLHERSQRWDLLLRCKMDDMDSDESIINLAKTRLALDADCWMSVLRYFSSLPPSPQRIGVIQEALNHIEQYNVLPPLLALRVLSEQGNIQLGTVKQYLIRQIKRASSQAESDQIKVRQLREDTERMRREAKALETEPKIFNATTCCMTGAPLELPVVHFMSGNSYNISSLPNSSDGRLEDPKSAEDRTVIDIAEGLARRRVDVDEEFFSELQARQGGESAFSFVAEYFGKCLFDEDDDHVD